MDKDGDMINLHGFIFQPESKRVSRNRRRTRMLPVQVGIVPALGSDCGLPAVAGVEYSVIREGH